jgi:hypothetical protein
LTHTGHIIKAEKCEIVVSNVDAPGGVSSVSGGVLSECGAQTPAADSCAENDNTLIRAASDQVAVLDLAAGFAVDGDADAPAAGDASPGDATAPDTATAADSTTSAADATFPGTTTSAGDTALGDADAPPAGDTNPGDAAPPTPLSNEEVMEYTASKWKYIPVPDSEPEPYPEYITAYENYPGCELTGARVRGKKHKHEGTNCDDWFSSANIGEWIILAVSDGAGSKKYSRIGAKASCEAVVEYLKTAVIGLQARNPNIESDISAAPASLAFNNACGELALAVQSAVISAFDAVERSFLERRDKPEYFEALGRKPQFNDFSGTLLVALIVPASSDGQATPASADGQAAPVSSGDHVVTASPGDRAGQRADHLVISCQIGDGMIALLDSREAFESSVKLMGKADGGDFSGETDFLTSSRMKMIPTLQGRTKLSLGCFNTLMMMTDGVADDYFPNDTEMRRLYFDLVINGILPNDSPNDTSKLNNDDVAIIKKLPDLLSYPWVNDPSRRISLQYAKRICEALNLSLADIWANRKILSLAAAEMSELSEIEDKSERLKIWLDNYVERGSFDDRTLVILRF